ncbi:unnamed protein product [Spirodela intermedia]|uniref:Uncharacterized protein n=1 Tax=Spirodela intermedia TaxID=51605 RepID=A0A7I8IMX3_SPIIN|nr:unnamed protein product [Spirodela intermedia]CAA6658903.1 unnamed protein product [Spirodela intermedia]
MEDVVTDIPPPSRFFPEDLDNFASPSPALPTPFVLLSDRNPRPRPSLMVVAISPASRLLVHRLSPKPLFGALFLPELPLAGNHIVPSPRDSGCNIYAAGEGILLVSFQYPAAAAAERARSVAKGVGAALLAECQMRKLKGTLCVAWPGAGEASSPSSSLESLLRDLLPGLRFSADNGVRVSVADSDLSV